MTERRPLKRWRHLLWLLPLVLAVTVGAYVGWLQGDTSLAVGNGEPTLIVLPLRPVGSLHDEGVLAEGLSQDLITPLARIKGLRVIASTSALRAASDHLDAAQLAQRLGVTHTLQGSLRELWPQVHLELHLNAAPSDKVLWSRVYDRSLADAPALEHEIAQAVAQALDLHLPAAAAAGRADAPENFRDYLEARRLQSGPQHARGIDLQRALVSRAPDYARAQAALARILAGNLRLDQLAPGDLDEAAHAARHAQELDPELAEAHAALAILACRTADWVNCMQEFRRALELDPADAECRFAYAYWLGALGFMQEGVQEAETGWLSDPLDYNANFLRARMLDTVGRHNEAARYLDAATPPTAGLAYAHWHNAVWRGDLEAATKLAATMPQSDGFRESYIVVSEALAEPRLWSQALPLIGTSERASGHINTLRIMMPNPDYAVVLGGLEKMLRDGWPSYYLLLWMPEYAAMRRDPAFQDFLKRTRLLDYWREHGFPAQCHPDGDGAICS